MPNPNAELEDEELFVTADAILYIRFLLQSSLYCTKRLLLCTSDHVQNAVYPLKIKEM
jgi:hypothetical protein